MKALLTQSSKQLSPESVQHYFALCRFAVSNCD